MKKTNYLSRPNYQAWQLANISPAQFGRLSPKEQLNYLCKLAVLAPSTHNSQPWRFGIDEKVAAIDIYLDQNSILPESDPDGRQAAISVGCAMENILTAARHFGLRAKSDVNSDRSVPIYPQKNKKAKITLLARITFQKDNTAPKSNQKSFDAIFTRKVTRAEFDITKKIPAETLRNLKRLRLDAGLKLEILSARKELLQISELQAQADGFVVNNAKFARELGNWILENNAKSYLGMPGSTFGLRDPQAKYLHNALLGKIKLNPEEMLKFSQGTKFLMERSGIIVTISAGTDKPADWLRAGVAMQKILLFLEANKIQASIHAGLTEVKLAGKIFASNFGVQGKLLGVIRAGYAKRKNDLKWPHSPRLPLEKILIDKS